MERQSKKNVIKKLNCSQEKSNHCFVKLMKKSCQDHTLSAEDFVEAEHLLLMDIQFDLKKKKDYYHKMKDQFGLFEEQ